MVNFLSSHLIFYTLIVHYVINFVFSIEKQPYMKVINFVSYIHVVHIIIIIGALRGRQGGLDPPPPS